MRISKKQLAKIIHGNGGWRGGAQFAAQGGLLGYVEFYASKPVRESVYWRAKEGVAYRFLSRTLLPNWHQTILSRDEYFHLYPVPETEPEPLAVGDRCEVAELGGVVGRITALDTEGSDFKYQVKLDSGLIAWVYDACLSTAPEPVAEAKPTIEQLAADYHNRKDYADRKQQEADAAKADADAKLAELVAAGKALGLVLSVAEKEPELVITDWRDLEVGDRIWVGDSGYSRNCPEGEYEIAEIDSRDSEQPVGLAWPGVWIGVTWPGVWIGVTWPEIHKRGWRFIRRPAKGDANA